MDERQQKKLDAKRNRAMLVEKARVDRWIGESLASVEGRAFLWWLLSEGGFGSNPHTGNSLHTSFKCGELNVALKLVARLGDIDPAGFVRMQHERLTDELSIRSDSVTEPGTSADPGADSFAGTEPDSE